MVEQISSSSMRVELKRSHNHLFDPAIITPTWIELHIEAKDSRDLSRTQQLLCALGNSSVLFWCCCMSIHERMSSLYNLLGKRRPTGSPSRKNSVSVQQGSSQSTNPSALSVSVRYTHVYHVDMCHNALSAWTRNCTSPSSSSSQRPNLSKAAQTNDGTPVERRALAASGPEAANSRTQAIPLYCASLFVRYRVGR